MSNLFIELVFVILMHASDSLCFGLKSLFIKVAGRRSMESKVVFPLYFPPCPLYCPRFIIVTGAFLGVWGHTTGLSGFTSYQYILHLLADCQQWKLQNVSGNEPPLSDTVVNAKKS